VTADDVYVRSGPGSNYYPTTKLHAADRIMVQGEQYGWLKITPPAGSFSFVDMTLVERVGDKGRVSADNVRVRAGSTLVTQKREVQLMLPKGTEVSILGEADGLYKILPPANACLWISGQYVRPFTGTALVRKKPRPTEAAPAPAVAARPPAMTTPPPAVTPAVTAPETPSGSAAAPGGSAGSTGGTTTLSTEVTSSMPADGGPRVSVLPENEAATARITSLMSGSPIYGPRVIEADKQLREALTQPEVNGEKLKVLLQEFEAISQQTEEPVAQAVAQARAGQVRARVDLLDYRTRVEAEHRELDAYRQQMGQDRANIRTVYPPGQPRGYDFKGILRVSQVFDAGVRRYRLVDPANQRTLAYVDVPPQMDENIAGMIGQYVGVRAVARTYDSGARVSVVVAEAIDPLGNVPASAPASAGSGTAGS